MWKIKTLGLLYIYIYRFCNIPVKNYWHWKSFGTKSAYVSIYIYIWIRMWLPFCPLVSMNIKSWTQLWLELTLEKSQFNGTEFIRTKNSSMWMCQLHVSSRPLDSMLIKSSTFWLELVLLLDKIFIGQNLSWIKVGLC